MLNLLDPLATEKLPEFFSGMLNTAAAGIVAAN